MVMQWVQNIPSSQQSMEEGCLRAHWLSQRSSCPSESDGHQTRYPKWLSNQEGGPRTPSNLDGRCLSQHEIAAPKSLPNPMPHGERGNPQEVLKFLLSQNAAYHEWVLRANNIWRKMDRVPQPWSLSLPYF